MTGFVQAYDKSTGKKVPHLVPDHFIGGNLTLTPQAAAQQRPAAAKRATTPAPKRATKSTPSHKAGGSDATGHTGATTPAKKD